MESNLDKLKKKIASIPNFPRKGVLFRDISPLLGDTECRELAFDEMAKLLPKDLKINLVAGLDARGFIFGTALASRLKLPFVMIGKQSKIPYPIPQSSNMEYGGNVFEVQRDTIPKGANVLLVDDILATGGSLMVAATLIGKCEANVAACICLIELDDLNGKKNLEKKTLKSFSLLKFPAYDPSVKPIPREVVHRTMYALKDDPRAILLYHPSMQSIARDICTMYSKQFRLGTIIWEFFADGYPNIKFEELSGLENRHVVFLMSMYDKALLLEQLSMLMVLPRQFVKSLQIVLPYFATATMERVDEEGVLATAETAAKIIGSCLPTTRSGPSILRIFDIHALPVRFYFPDTVLVKLMSAIPLLTKELQKNVTIAFPDEGAAKRFKKMFENYSIVICSKVRDGESRFVKVVETINWPQDPSSALEHVLIVDDLCHTGGTLDECRKALLSFGAKKVSAFVTHGVFDNDCYKRFAKGGDREGFFKFYTTNTIPEVATKLLGVEPFHVISVSDMLGVDCLDMIEQPLEKSPATPITVYVSSTAKSKLEAARRAFKQLFKFSIVDIIGIGVESNVNSQPINEQTKLGCENRLKNMLDHLTQKKAKIDVDTYLVSMESGMFETKDKKWEDITVVQVQNNMEVKEARSKPTMCPEGIMELVKMKNYKVTAGNIIEKQHGYQNDSWHFHIANMHRSEIMKEPILEALHAFGKK